MITKIVEDRAILEDLISRLRQSNIELESAQQGLIRSEKMAVVGRLAAGLAHEIGNPLQIVMGYLELLQRGPDPESAADILSRMDSELKRIHNTLARLLEFARPLRENVKRCNINEVVKDSGTLLKGRQGLRNIELVHSLDEDLPLVATEPEKIRQILVNLIFNAVDAIPQSGGKIILRTRRHGDSVQIEVEDSGSGIAGENLEKVFDPFFTTKEPGKGTGLGLTVCQALAASLGGSVDIISAEGKGACVVVALPIGEDEE
jgi:signal transduction histidine kinase